MTKRSENQLSEQEERLLSAFLDNELTASEQRSVESRIAANEAAVLDELERLQFAKSELQTFFKAEVTPAGAGIDIWSKIQSEIKREARKPGEPGWIEQLGAAFRQLMQPRLAAAVGGLAAVLLLSFQLRSGDQLEGSQVALMRGGVDVPTFSAPETEAPSQPLLLATNRSEDILSKIGIENPNALPAGLPVPEALAVRLLSQRQIFADRRIPGGLRAGETDIEWIKTHAPFRMVSTKRPDASPVIWVARQK